MWGSKMSEDKVNISLPWEDIAGCGIFDDLPRDKVFELLGGHKKVSILNILENPLLFADDKLWIIEDKFNPVRTEELAFLIRVSYEITGFEQADILCSLIKDASSSGLEAVNRNIVKIKKHYLSRDEWVHLCYRSKKDTPTGEEW